MLQIENFIKVMVVTNDQVYKAGDCIVTKGYALPTTYIIHTVTPHWLGGFVGEKEKLVSCYKNVLSIAKQMDIKSLAFPLLSAGIRGFQEEKAMHVAISEILRSSYGLSIHIYLVLYEKE